MLFVFVFSGQLTVWRALDRELVDSYTLSVTVSDGKHVSLIFLSYRLLFDKKTNGYVLYALKR